MLEQLGIVDALQARRALYARYIAPRPWWVPTPALPTIEPEDPRLSAALDQFLSDVATILITPRPPKPVPPRAPVPSILDVQRAFLYQLYEHGYWIGGRPVTLGDLIGVALSRRFTYPRHVAIGLAREITGASLPAIGKAFGDRDHTTCLFALRMVPDRLAKDAILARVHAKVLADFKVSR